MGIIYICIYMSIYIYEWGSERRIMSGGRGWLVGWSLRSIFLRRIFNDAGNWVVDALNGCYVKFFVLNSL